MTSHLQASPTRTPSVSEAIFRLGSRAFSLVETVLALGIVSFGCVSIMGLLPCGLQVFRKAMDITLEGQITQQVVGQIGQSPYDRLAADFHGKTFWFDQEGNAVAKESDEGIYRADISLDTQPILPGTHALAAGNLTAVTIVLQRRNETGPVGTSKTFVTYVAAKARQATP
ncbi:MAG: Verru_Chthon cassette protein B [Chthoniobacterales bacterium]|nr:Verru_Chthon cassette protein B [Chthoniobacterales bacterium]